MSVLNLLRRYLDVFALILKFIFRIKRYNFNEKSADVSMTSYGNRIKFIFIVIEKIFKSNVTPRNIYLTIDFDENITAIKKIVLKKLQWHGVKILYGDKIGPHAKYYTYLVKVWNGIDPFILMDDDVLYRRDIIEKLLSAHKNNSNSNICVRSFIVEKNLDNIASYKDWSFCTKKIRSPRVFATNVGGVLVCRDFAIILKKLDKEFLKKCPRADDVWFHWISVRYHMPYFCCVSDFINPPVLPLSQNGALHIDNNSGGNDLQIANTYEESDVKYIFG